MEAPRDGHSADPPPGEPTTSREPTDGQTTLARWQATFDRSPQPQALLDLQGRLKQANAAWCRLFDASAQELVEEDLATVIDPAEAERVREALLRLRDGSAHSATIETTARRQDGTAIQLTVTTTPVTDTTGRALEIVAFARTRQEHHVTEGGRAGTGSLHRPRDREETDVMLARYRAIVETAQEGILAVSPEGDVLFANRRLTEILGLSMDEVHALGRHGLFAPAKAARAARRLSARPREAGPERSDLPYRHPEGGDRVLHVSASALTSADGSVLGSLAMVSDVTEQRAAERSLRHQALHDALTGLPNRLLFVDRLNTAAARQDRSGDGTIAVLFLDLDHFKLVNDTHGHQVGDRLLVEVASRLEQAVRATDTVARLGGDEFAVICEGDGSRTASLVSSRIQQAFKAPVVADGYPIEVGVSIGVALSPPHSAADLLRLADSAMYRAKAAARGSVVTYGDVPRDGRP